MIKALDQIIIYIHLIVLESIYLYENKKDLVMNI